MNNKNNKDKIKVDKNNVFNVDVFWSGFVHEGVLCASAKRNHRNSKAHFGCQIEAF